MNVQASAEATFIRHLLADELPNAKLRLLAKLFMTNKFYWFPRVPSRTTTTLRLFKTGTGKQRECHNIPAQIPKWIMLVSNRLFVCGFVTNLEHVGATVIFVSLPSSISIWPKPCQGPTQPCSLYFQPDFYIGRLPTTTCGTSWRWLSPWPPWLAFCMWRSVQQLMLVSVPWMSGD